VVKETRVMRRAWNYRAIRALDVARNFGMYISHVKSCHQRYS